MKVSELARAAGVSADTVRFYTRAGLLHPRRDPDNGYQHFAATDLQRLRFARKARQLGFTLKEVIAILGDADEHRSPCPQVRDLFAQKLAAVEQQLLELTELRDRMRAATRQWRKMPDGAPDGHTICRLVERWDDAPTAIGRASGKEKSQ
jgi:MerR family transcriptional regulator, Zn(II)-responsive regulator of zntA